MEQIKALKVGIDNVALYPVLLQDDDNLVLVDCGFSHYLPLIKAAAATEGIDLDRLTGVILTHCDFDHTGALAELKAAYPSVKIMASALQAEYISGARKNIRLERALRRYEESPNEETKAEVAQRTANTPQPVPVDVILSDNEVLALCGGVKVLPTPGHMPGHISLYVGSQKALITGDAMTEQNGKLGGANPKYTFDMELARENIRSFLAYDIETVICYHGGVFTEEIKRTLHELSAEPV